MSSRSESLKRLVTKFGWEPESDSTAGLVDQLSRMFDVTDGKVILNEPPAYVAKVGKRGFETIPEAIDAARGGTIRLVADIGGFEVPSGKSARVDLNGHSVTSASAAITNGGVLTIIGEGTVESTGSYAIKVLDRSVTTVESGTVRGVEGAIVTGKSVGATVHVKGGTLVATDNAVIAGNGSGDGGNSISVSGGTLSGRIRSNGYVACGIYCPTDDTVTVTGGTFDIEGGCGICARAGKVSVTGCSITTTGTAIGKVGDSRVVVPCSAIVFDSEAGYPALSDDDVVKVLGGRFASDAEPVSGDSHIRLYGGTYSGPVPEECLPSGFSCVQVADKYVVRG